MSDGWWAVDLDRAVLAATGPEAASFLQGQLSQDVVGLADGGFAWSWLLAPNGKVDALLRVTRVSADEWLLDTDAGWAEPVLTRLNRFKLRTKVDMAPARGLVVGLRGDGWEEASGRLAGSGVVLTPPWPHVEGADVLIRDGFAGFEGFEGAAPPLLPAQDYEAHRILAGIPKMGAELDERTIPAETGLVAMTVSFTKGCYTGQELVARIDSRGGHVPRHLRGLRGTEGAPPPEAGTELLASDGRPAGVVTSAAPGPGEAAGRAGRAGWVGLGYVKRGVEVGEVLTAGPGVEVTQVELTR